MQFIFFVKISSTHRITNTYKNKLLIVIMYTLVFSIKI